ncbi:6443_t:CDS:1, partial [Acaulospora colombiana]
ERNGKGQVVALVFGEDDEADEEEDDECNDTDDDTNDRARVAEVASAHVRVGGSNLACKVGLVGATKDLEGVDGECVAVCASVGQDDLVRSTAEVGLVELDISLD